MAHISFIKVGEKFGEEHTLVMLFQVTKYTNQYFMKIQTK